MPQIFRVGIFLVLMLSTKAFSQNYINSPYTRYKIGDLIDDGFAYNRSLGGSSIGIRPHNQINYLNPASYTNQDTTSFLMQIGLTGRMAKVSTEFDNDKSLNFNIEYLTIGFPVTKWWNMSVGATPFSRIQYSVREQTDSINLGEKMTFDYSGSGGFNQFYIGNAFKFGNLLSIGANVAYLFGSLDRKQSSYLTDYQYRSARIEQSSNYIAGDFYFKLGAQFHPIIKDKHKIVLGATYDFKSNINTNVKGKTIHFNEFDPSTPNNYLIDTITYNSGTKDTFVLPAKLALGFSYNYNDIVMITGEYIRQDWAGTGLISSNVKTGLYESYRFGIEFVPEPYPKKVRTPYYNRIHYRAGYYHANTYLNFNNKPISNYGFSAGIGLPIKYDRKAFYGTTFDIGYQYGIRGTTNNGLIQENIHMITFGLTLHDFWFLKPKYD
jgi:hypothetical protein